jgi:hypothetical protein
MRIVAGADHRILFGSSGSRKILATFEAPGFNGWLLDELHRQYGCS